MQTATTNNELDLVFKPLEKVEDLGSFQLLVLFNMSNTPLLLEEGPHGFCVDSARKMIKLIMAESSVHTPGYTFRTTVRPSMKYETCIVVMRTNEKRTFPTSGLYATFAIQKRIDRSEYDNPLGVVNKHNVAKVIGGVSDKEANGSNALKEHHERRKNNG